jgi:hypothetical protein
MSGGLIIYTKATNLTDKATGNKYYITTEGNILFIVNIVHRLTVRKVKKCLKTINKWGNMSLGRKDNGRD